MHCAVLGAGSWGTALALLLGACGEPLVVPDSPEDCDDPDPRTHVGATEVCGDGVINDCETTEEDLPRYCLSRDPGTADVTYDCGPDGEFGAIVSALGDFDGDGVADVLVGRPDVPAELSATIAYVFSTSHSGTVSSDSAIAALWSTEFERGNPLSMAGAGDVDLDGLADLIIGARARSYLVLGGGEGEVSLSDAHLVVRNEGEFGSSSSAVAGGGDFDGDGVPDLLIGASASSSAGASTGAAFVVSGATSGEVTMDDALFTALGDKGGAEFGASVDFAGDFDGDGLDDIIIGAPMEFASDGGAFVVLGGQEGVWDRAEGGEIRGDSMYGQAGTAVRGGGDCDGDGLDDVLVHTPTYWYWDYYESGSVEVFLGTSLAEMKRLESYMDVHGTEHHSHLGSSMDFAGDVDGDGRDDILAGSADRGVEELEAGFTFILYCGDGGISGGELDRAVIAGLGPGTWEGDQVAGLGDVDGDSLPDLLLGTPFDGTAQLVLLRHTW